MERLITESKSSLLFLLLVVAASCSVVKNANKQLLRGRIILVSSVLDDEKCTLRINNSVYLLSAKIATDRTLGIDLTNQIEIDTVTNPVRFEISFNGNISNGEGIQPQHREIRMDTVLDLRQAKYIFFKAQIDKVLVGKSKKKLELF